MQTYLSQARQTVQILRMAYDKELPNTEIARRVNLSTSTISRRLTELRQYDNWTVMKMRKLFLKENNRPFQKYLRSKDPIYNRLTCKVLDNLKHVPHKKIPRREHLYAASLKLAKMTDRMVTISDEILDAIPKHFKSKTAFRRYAKSLPDLR